MSTISAPGLGSGLDVNSIVSQLVALERQPIKNLQTQQNGLRSQLSAFGKLQGAISALRDAARPLATPATWNATTAASSDAASVGASTGPLATPGHYSVQVQRLATSQFLASPRSFGATESVGAGTLRIELGRWSEDKSAFASRDPAAAVEVSIAPGEDTLDKIRDQINRANAGVTASIVNDASGSRLVLRSSATGAENAFRVTATHADPGAAPGSGLEALAYDPSAGITAMTESQAAGDARATINNIPVTSASNTLADVIDGLTLKLSRTTTAPVEVSVAQNSESMKASITAFANAYNDVIKLLREQTRYDAASKTAGTLQGDRSAINLQTQLRTLFTGSSTASAVYQRLADIGLDPQADGTVKVDAARLDDALAKNAQEVRRLFATLDESQPAHTGFAQRFRTLADGLLNSEGLFETRSSGLQKRIELNGKRQTELENRVALVEKRLKAQYGALDTKMSTLSGLSSYVSQQITNWNKPRT